MADQHGWEKNNPRQQESYWEGRSDPRDKPDSHMKYNSHYYKVIDRQIAADNHERQGQGQSGTGQGGGAGSGTGQGKK